MDMMREMQGEGMPGMSMYSRDELMQQMEQYQGMYDGEGYEDYGDEDVSDEHPQAAAFGDEVSPKAILQDTIETVKGTLSTAMDSAKKAASAMADMFSGKGNADSEL